jgi:hypothetical protein
MTYEPPTLRDLKWHDTMGLGRARLLRVCLPLGRAASTLKRPLASHVDLYGMACIPWRYKYGV